MLDARFATSDKLLQSRAYQTYRFPIVQESGIQFFVKLDRNLIPVQDVQHNSKTMFLFCDCSDTRQQCQSNLVLAELRANKQVLQEQAATLECRIRVEEKSVTSGLAIEIRNERPELSLRSKSILLQSLFGDQNRKLLIVRHLLDERIEQRDIIQNCLADV